MSDLNLHLVNGLNQFLLPSDSDKILPEINRNLPDYQHGNVANNKLVLVTLTQRRQY